MAVWILTGDCGDGVEYHALVDSVTMRPVNMALIRASEFDQEDVEDFLQHLARQNKDVRMYDPESLERMWNAWRAG